jgi:hypothetical protein
MCNVWKRIENQGLCKATPKERSQNLILTYCYGSRVHLKNFAIFYSTKLLLNPHKNQISCPFSNDKLARFNSIVCQEKH